MSTLSSWRLFAPTTYKLTQTNSLTVIDEVPLEADDSELPGERVALRHLVERFHHLIEFIEEPVRMGDVDDVSSPMSYTVRSR